MFLMTQAAQKQPLVIVGGLLQSSGQEHLVQLNYPEGSYSMLPILPAACPQKESLSALGCHMQRVMEAGELSSAGQEPYKASAESNEKAAAQPKQAASASAKSSVSDEPTAKSHDGLKQSQHTIEHEPISKQPVRKSEGHAATQPTANQPVQSQHATEQGPTSKKSQPVSGTKEHAQSKPPELPATSAAVSEPAVQADQQATSKKGAPLQPSQAAIQRASTLKETAKAPKAESKVKLSPCRAHTRY